MAEKRLILKIIGAARNHRERDGGGELALEEMIKHFEEGSKLVTLCSKKLTEVEQKIEKLVKKGDGLGTEPFETSE